MSSPALTAGRLGPAIAASTGLKGQIIAFGGPSSDVYLDPALRGADRTKALDALLATYRAHPQVSAVFTKEEIARTAIAEGMLTLKQDGIEKVLQGHTDLRQVRTVCL